MNKKAVLHCCTLIALFSACRESRAQSSIIEYRQGTSNDAYRVGLGSIYNYDLRYSHSYLGFNISPKPDGTWGMGSDNTISPTGNGNAGNNGGSMLLGGLAGELFFITIPSAATNVSRSYSSAALAGNIKMTLDRTGRLQIGNTLPDQALHSDYKLAVAGKIVSQSLYITNPSTWSDFVFSNSYHLRPLTTLGAYIKDNQHLPDMPGASQVMRDGYDVNQMNAALLQKVEELTLYVLQLNEKIELLEKKSK